MRQPDFAGVGSLAIRRTPDGTATHLVAAEPFFDRWQGALVPYPARVVERRLPDGVWQAASMPPFGTRSEIELCGELAGAAIVRVDHQVFVHQSVSLGRWLLGR